MDKICAVVSKKYDIPAEEIKGKKRNKEIAKARHISIYLIKHLTSLPLTSIGALMGNRDHATILFSFNKIRGLDLFHLKSLLYLITNPV